MAKIMESMNCIKSMLYFESLDTLDFEIEITRREIAHQIKVKPQKFSELDVSGREINHQKKIC